jgi:hypothetical protein
MLSTNSFTRSKKRNVCDDILNPNCDLDQEEEEEEGDSEQESAPNRGPEKVFPKRRPTFKVVNASIARKGNK